MMVSLIFHIEKLRVAVPGSTQIVNLSTHQSCKPVVGGSPRQGIGKWLNREEIHSTRIQQLVHPPSASMSLLSLVDSQAAPLVARSTRAIRINECRSCDACLNSIKINPVSEANDYLWEAQPTKHTVDKYETFGKLI